MEASQELIRAAEAYDELFVPSLFGPWAPRVADAATVRAGQRVLDVACGTGVLTREVASRAGGTGSVAGVDPAPGMLAVARRRAPEVDFRDGTAEALPFGDGSFDAVVSQFGMMFFSDRGAAVREMSRVLAPGGHLAVAVWAALEADDAYAIMAELLSRMAGQDASDALCLPFALGDREQLRGIFADAGAAGTDVATHEGAAHFPSVRAMVEADLRGWLPLVGVTLDEPRIARILEEAERALARFVTASGSLRFPISAHIATWRKP